MTKVEVWRKCNSINRIKCNGHSGYAEHGEDIVCASLSSIVQTALLGLLTIAGINVDYKVDEDLGMLDIKIPNDITPEQSKARDYILETMFLGVADLYEGYSDFIELEVR